MLARSLLAAALYVVPVLALLLLAATAPRDRTPWLVASRIPLAVALDLMSVLTLTLFVRLEIAAVVTRVAWGAFALAVIVARRGRLRDLWPRGLNKRAALLASIAATTAVWVSLQGSRPYSMWDRKWHTPLVASIRGQELPFHNIWSRAEVLHYHFSGDVQAALLQTFSGDVIHSSLALSLAHDVTFALIGATLALLLVWHGMRSVAFAALATAAVVLAGPITLGREGWGRHADGYSVLNFLTMSFRPHDGVALLFLLGLIGATVARRRRGSAEPPSRAAITSLLASTAGLAISDEASLGLFALALGLVWLVVPDVLPTNKSRAVGVLVFVGMLLALAVPNVAFSAALSVGVGGGHRFAIAPWRSPGCYNPALPLTTVRGALMLAYDVGSIATIVAAGAVARLFKARLPSASFGLLAVLAALSTVALTRIEINRTPLEAHRFMAGVIVVAPVIGVIWLVKDGGLRGWLPWPDRAVVVALLLGGMGLGAASTLEWLYTIAPIRSPRHSLFYTRDDLYAVDCVADFGAAPLRRAAPSYVAKEIWYAFAGCAPIYAPALRTADTWTLTIGEPLFEIDAVRALDRAFVKRTEPLQAVCPVTTKLDRVCAWAEAHDRCAPLARRARVCELSPADRAAIVALGKPPRPP